MMRFPLLITVLTISLNSFSQDVIVRKSGENIYCQVTEEDSVTIYFTISFANLDRKSFISKSEVVKVIYNAPQEIFPPDTIIAKKIFGGMVFHYQNESLSMTQVGKLVKSNGMAYSLIKKAQVNSVISSILEFSGGFIVGWSLGPILTGGEPLWELMAFGAGIAVVSIPIRIKSERQAKGAVNIYNQGLLTSSFRNKNELRLIVSDRSIGLSFCF